MLTIVLSCGASCLVAFDQVRTTVGIGVLLPVSIEGIGFDVGSSPKVTYLSYPTLHFLTCLRDWEVEVAP